MDGRREQSRTEKHRSRENPDTRAVSPSGMVQVDDYPNLRLLCWNVGTRCISRKHAFALYERNWRWLDVARAPDPERALIDDLAREFGRGLINA